MTRVSEWPGQEAHKTDSKIPTLIWYDRHGNVRTLMVFTPSDVHVKFLMINSHFSKWLA